VYQVKDWTRVVSMKAAGTRGHKDARDDWQIRVYRSEKCSKNICEERDSIV
jgi:hypothetical protein